MTRYVKAGKVRIVFDGMAFVGADSETALRTALAAASQDRFWNVISLLYENQGVENTGWVTDSLLRSVGDAVPGVDTGRMLADRNSTAVDTAVAGSSSLAQQLGVQGTPSFAVGPRGRGVAARRCHWFDVGARHGARTVSDRALRVTILCLSVLGAAVAGYLTVAHLLHAQVACATGGCETVQTSRYAEVAGIPVAAGGLAGYALIGASAGFRADIARVVGAAAALAGFVFAVYLIYVQIGVIGAVCQWCLTSDVLLALLVAATFLRLREA